MDQGTTTTATATLHARPVFYKYSMNDVNHNIHLFNWTELNINVVLAVIIDQSSECIFEVW